MLIELKLTERAVWFSVRARALGSFLSGIVAVIAGFVLGVRSFLRGNAPFPHSRISQAYLDHLKFSLKRRARTAFAITVTLQGGWWIWATIVVAKFRVTKPTYDWSSDGFGHAFALYIFLTVGFQMNYLLLYVPHDKLSFFGKSPSFPCYD